MIATSAKRITCYVRASNTADHRQPSRWVYQITHFVLLVCCVVGCVDSDSPCHSGIGDRGGVVCVAVLREFVIPGENRHPAESAARAYSQAARGAQPKASTEQVRNRTECRRPLRRSRQGVGSPRWDNGFTQDGKAPPLALKLRSRPSAVTSACASRMRGMQAEGTQLPRKR